MTTTQERSNTHPRRNHSRWYWILNHIDLLAFGLAPIVFILGAIGFQKALGDGASWWDSAYYSLRLFMFECDVDPGSKKAWYLILAQWIAPLPLAAGIVRLCRTLLNQELWLSRARRQKNHAIICGLGRRGEWIAKSIARHGQSVLAVEIQEHHDAINEIREAGAVAICGDARDLSLMREAGIDRARQVIVVTGSDQVNLSIAQEIRKHLGSSRQKPEIIVALEAYETRSYFTDRLSGMGIRVVGFISQAALLLARKMTLQLIDTMGPIPTRPPVVAIEATSILSDELIRAFACMLQISGDDRPIIHVCSAQDEDEKRFRRYFPACNLAIDIRWSSKPADDLFAESEGGQPDVVIFGRQPDMSSLEAADRFLIRHPLDPSRVVACILDTGDLYELCLQQSDKRTPAVLSLFAIGMETGGDQDPFNSTLERTAREIHENYQKSSPKAPSWERLSEFKRNSNRHAVLHVEIKRAVWRKQGTRTKEEILGHLTRSEHMRWMAFNTMDGWRYAPIEEQDPDHRLHPCLRPFNELNMHDKRKDAENVFHALELPIETSIPEIADSSLER